MARRDLAWGKVAILIMKGVPGEIILRLSAGRRRRWGMVMRSHEGCIVNGFWMAAKVRRRKRKRKWRRGS